MIVWVLIIGGLIVGWSLYKSRTSQASTSQASTSAADVPQFVNQTYTTVSPPNVTVENTPPAPDVDTEPSFPPIKPPVTRPPAQPPVRGTGGYAAPGKTATPIFNAVYVVRRGDTLNSVAKRFGITRVELAHANGLGTGAGLRTGQKIHVPEPKGTGTPNKAA
jgi:LysM repeat protein